MTYKTNAKITKIDYISVQILNELWISVFIIDYLYIQVFIKLRWYHTNETFMIINSLTFAEYFALNMYEYLKNTEWYLMCIHITKI